MKELDFKPSKRRVYALHNGEANKNFFDEFESHEEASAF